jgi:hypothetical protein
MFAKDACGTIAADPNIEGLPAGSLVHPALRRKNGKKDRRSKKPIDSLSYQQCVCLTLTD